MISAKEAKKNANDYINKKISELKEDIESAIETYSSGGLFDCKVEIEDSDYLPANFH